VESAALDTMLGLNVRAAFVVAQAAARRMLADADRAARGGSIVNISSQLGRVALRGRSVYTMTKQIAENTKTLGTVAKDILKLKPDAMAADIGVKFHPGAAKFYKEAGINVKSN